MVDNVTWRSGAEKDHTQPHRESLCQGVRKESSSVSKTSDAGGTMQFLSIPSQGYPRVILIQPSQEHSQVRLVSCGCWTPPGLPFVTDSAHNFYGQNGLRPLEWSQNLMFAF